MTCNDNQLTSLNASGCTKLNSLLCYNNQLKSLDVTDCRALTSLWCFSNKLKGKAMNAFIESLPMAKQSLYLIATFGDEGNVCTKSQVAAAKDKGWTILTTGGQAYEGIDETTNVEIPSCEYRSYVTAFDTDFTQTEGITAYKVVKATAEGVTLLPVENALAGCAVVLHGAENTYTLHYSYDDVKAHEDNLLKAGGEQMGDGISIYTLAEKDGNVGFYLLDYGVSVPASEGYLEIPSAGGAVSLPFIDGTVGIYATTTKMDAADVIYNLAGQRVTQPAKSGIYIVNGKRMFINK